MANRLVRGLSLGLLMITLGVVIAASVRSSPRLTEWTFIPEALARWADGHEHSRHFVALAIVGLLGVWVGRLVFGQRSASWRPYMVTLAGGVSLTIGLELMQLGQPLRTFDFADILWGIAGLLVGLGLARLGNRAQRWAELLRPLRRGREAR